MHCLRQSKLQLHCTLWVERVAVCSSCFSDTWKSVFGWWAASPFVRISFAKRSRETKRTANQKKTFDWAMFSYSEQHIFALLLYGFFGLATIASDMDISGNYEVEYLYSLSSLSYGHNSRQLLFSVSTIITTTLDDSRRNIASRCLCPSSNHLCSPLHSCKEIWSMAHNIVQLGSLWLEQWSTNFT
jgi:hypothetical protein